MPGIAHASFQQKNYRLVYHILHGFLSQPEPTAAREDARDHAPPTPRPRRVTPMINARVALVILALLASPLGGAVAFTPDPVDLAAARREGGVTWYTSTPVSTAQKIASLFEAETGIKVELFRSGGSAVLRRFLQEIDARRVVADVMTISDPAAASALIKRDLLVPIDYDLVEREAKKLKDPFNEIFQ
jgi:spermidine/putrescine-binding protein